METPYQQETPQPMVNIDGEKVALGPLHGDLLPLYWKWFNDFEYLRTTGQTGQPRPMTWEAMEESYQLSSKAEDAVHFVVYERSSMRPIGGAALTGINALSAEFSIGIGEKDVWGKGYGTEVTRLTLDYGFNALGLHNIMLVVHGDNERGIRAYARAGFRVIGRRREVINRGGRLIDLVYMDCLATEFKRMAP